LRLASIKGVMGLDDNALGFSGDLTLMASKCTLIQGLCLLECAADAGVSMTPAEIGCDGKWANNAATHAYDSRSSPVCYSG
jgi:hypothetical protein